MGSRAASSGGWRPCRLDGLKGHFQLKPFCDSVILRAKGDPPSRESLETPNLTNFITEESLFRVHGGFPTPGLAPPQLLAVPGAAPHGSGAKKTAGCTEAGRSAELRALPLPTGTCRTTGFEKVIANKGGTALSGLRVTHAAGVSNPTAARRRVASRRSPGLAPSDASFQLRAAQPRPRSPPAPRRSLPAFPTSAWRESAPRRRAAARPWPPPA